MLPEAKTNIMGTFVEFYLRSTFNSTFLYMIFYKNYQKSDQCRNVSWEYSFSFIRRIFLHDKMYDTALKSTEMWPLALNLHFYDMVGNDRRLRGTTSIRVFI